MNRMLKNSLLGTAVLMFFFLTATHTGMAGEEVPAPVPLIPMTVEGVALIDGDPAPKGTVVAAYLNGTQVEEFLINTSSGDFTFYISGKAEDEGKSVTFKVGEKDADTKLDWKSGTKVSSIELSVGVVADSGSSKKSSTSSTSSGSAEINESKTSGAEVIESSVTQPNVTTVSENAVADSGEDTGAEKSAESSEASTETSSAPGFQIIYAVAGIILLTFGSKLGRESKRKP
ncbi:MULTISPECIES: hypothetical protein [unclassified Methanosarcina]|uniref:hypothetical protein n=1 Tax=unclassified Methanosarcina TaxID=2644672 RepID=UPI000615DBBB|nr:MULTISPECIES: hypothetical protein [unclassified Methanosarcina]AKB18425.1 hypothetical protein MSWHS_1562 [Methanosarcina sp. WWM596]AKB22024.1 hypothetical protein MSWH1_1753 [Methanosarcina sp. WH1]